MSNDKALAIRPATITPTTYDGFGDLAERFAKATIIPSDLRSKPEDVFVTLLAGNELGLSPMASLRGIHVVKGKPILSADTMVGLVLSRGARYFRCVAESDTSVTYETHREGAPEPQRATWTIQDAERAGLIGGDNWKKYPRAMLKARCKAVLARDVYPDVLAGCYVEEERAEIESAPTRVDDVIDAEFTQGEKLPEVTADAMTPFLVAIEPLVGDATDGWTADDVIAEVRRVAAAACKEGATKRDFNDAMKPWHAVVEKAGSSPSLDRVRAEFRAIYAAGLATFKKS